MFDTSNAPGFLIRRLQQISVQIFARNTASAGLSGVQYGALQIIRQKAGIDQITLAQAVDIDRTTTTRIVDRLFRAGLIVRKANPDNRRSNCLSITAKGSALLRKIERKADESQLRLLAPLTAEQRVTFMKMLRKLVLSHSQVSGKAARDDEDRATDNKAA
jgi:DNA-binding MarR family transcriptional regulator